MLDKPPHAGSGAHREVGEGAMVSCPRIASVGDCAVTVEFGEVIDNRINAEVLAFDRALAAGNVPGIVETVPAFRSLLIVYEPEVISHAALVASLAEILSVGPDRVRNTGRSWTIPVAYGCPDDGDLHEVAAAKGLTTDQVIDLHSSAEYQVFLVGFVPGLPVLGGLPEALHIPRRPAPRLGLSTGRVMIGGMQGLIVPMPMPTGYYSLGYTPARPFRPGRPSPFLFRSGDTIRFRPVSPREADGLAHVPAEHFLNGAE